MKKLTIRDVDLKGKRVLMRVDFNVPTDENGQIADDLRIRAALPTLRYILEQKTSIVLMSHLGRPKGGPSPEFSLKPVAARLEELLASPVIFCASIVGPEAEAMAQKLKSGQVMMLENLRFHDGETKNDPTFSSALAKLGDLYVDDAFGCAHRAHASIVGVAECFPVRVAGLLMERELDVLGGVLHSPEKPYVAILGGAKIADKIPLIRNLLPRIDSLLVGGGMSNSFLKAKGYEIGNSIVDDTSLPSIRSWFSEYPKKIILPVDALVADGVSVKENRIGETRIVAADAIDKGWEKVDIGPKTVDLFSNICQDARTIIWNGPVGVFEIDQASKGTMAIAKLLARLHKEGVKTVVGGGDTAFAVKEAGLTDAMFHVSTGGGASLEFLEGLTLPGVAVLTDRKS